MSILHCKEADKHSQKENKQKCIFIYLQTFIFFFFSSWFHAALPHILLHFAWGVKQLYIETSLFAPFFFFHFPYEYVYIYIIYIYFMYVNFTNKNGGGGASTKILQEEEDDNNIRKMAQ